MSKTIHICRGECYSGANRYVPTIWYSKEGNTTRAGQGFMGMNFSNRKRFAIDLPAPHDNKTHI